MRRASTIERLEAGGDAAFLNRGAELDTAPPSGPGPIRRPRPPRNGAFGRRAISRSRRFSICVASCWISERR